MDSTSLIQLLQKSFHVTLGATASLVEVLQDPLKREQNLSKLRLELTELAQEWSEKGEMTEVEARNFVNNLLSQSESQLSSTQSTPETSSSSATTSVADPNVQLELQELTAQLGAIRAELEKLQNEPNT
jgi:polyhydroxyalkanoate synthesis regulator phasin